MAKHRVKSLQARVQVADGFFLEGDALFIQPLVNEIADVTRRRRVRAGSVVFKR
jgi:hypothetical protein